MKFFDFLCKCKVFFNFLAAMVLITLKFLSRTVHRGFTCGDPALSLQRHPDTVTNVMLVIWGTSPVLIVSEIYFNGKFYFIL